MAARRSALLTAFAAVYIIWGSTYLAIRYTVLTIPPYLVAGSRFIIAGVILYTWVIMRTDERPTLLHWRNAAIVGLLLLTGGNSAVTWAEQVVPSGITALLIAIVPLWIVVLMWIRPGGRRPSLGVMAGIIVGFAGMIVLVGLGALRGDSTISLAGVGALVAGSLLWAAGSLFARTASLPSPLLTTAMEMLVGGAGALFVALCRGELSNFSLHAVSTQSMQGLLYLTVFGSLGAFTAYSWLLKHASPVAVGTYAYVNPIVAVFLGWLIANEPVTPRTLVGAAIIIVAVAIITTTQARDTAHEH